MIERYVIDHRYPMTGYRRTLRIGLDSGVEVQINEEVDAMDPNCHILRLRLPDEAWSRIFGTPEIAAMFAELGKDGDVVRNGLAALVQPLDRLGFRQISVEGWYDLQLEAS